MSDWLAWQIVDSAFPTGTFAHSWGLEAAWQQGEVNDLSALRAFLRMTIQQTGHASLPLMSAAYRCPERLEELDELTEAFTLNAVVNRASRVQGRTLLATASRVWPCDALDVLASRVERTCAHLAPLSGVAFCIIGVPLATVQRIALYATARGVLSAAVRLGIAGSYEAQRMQSECGPWLDRIAECCANLSEQDVAQTAPVLDLLHSGHDRLYSRLFQS